MDEAPRQTDWRQWLECHASRFLLFARQQTQSEADAQDLVQEALVEASRPEGNQFPPAPALVFTIIRRRAIDLARRETRRANRESASTSDAEFWFDTGLEDREHAELLQNAMKRLPDIYREVIMLKIWGELTFAEIGVAVGVPANTAASRYRYGLGELRKLTKEVLT